MATESSIGLISGQGALPRAIALDARARGYRVFVVALEHLSDDLSAHADKLKRLNAGKVGGIMEFFGENGVKEVVMAGKVPKTLLLKGGLKPDLRAMKMLMTLKDHSDEGILSALAREAEKEGIRFLKITDFASGLLAPEGVLTGKKPSKDEWKDIEFGFKMAKAIGGLDIGQTVVVKGQSVVAVEALEGTDETIRRAGRLTDGGATVVKVSKPDQDMRFDVPVVGMETLSAMLEADIAALAVEAGKCIFLDRDALIAEADEAGIKVVGFAGHHS